MGLELIQRIILSAILNTINLERESFNYRLIYKMSVLDFVSELDDD